MQIFYDLLKSSTKGNTFNLDANYTQRSIGDKEIQKLLDYLRTATVKNVIFSYNELSDDYGVMIAKVVKENHNIKTVAFYSERLGDATAKAFGEITTLTELILQNCHVEEEGAVALAAGLTNNNTLQELCLSGNAIEDQGAIALGDMLKSNKSLISVSVVNCSIGEDGMQKLLASVKKHPKLNEMIVHDGSEEDSYEEDSEVNNYFHPIQLASYDLVLVNPRISKISDSSELLFEPIKYGLEKNQRNISALQNFVLYNENKTDIVANITNYKNLKKLGLDFVFTMMTKDIDQVPQAIQTQNSLHAVVNIIHEKFLTLFGVCKSYSGSGFDGLSAEMMRTIGSYCFPSVDSKAISNINSLCSKIVKSAHVHGYNLLLPAQGVALSGDVSFNTDGLLDSLKTVFPSDHAPCS